MKSWSDPRPPEEWRKYPAGDIVVPLLAEFTGEIVNGDGVARG
jgi:hypothetical protein